LIGGYSERQKYQDDNVCFKGTQQAAGGSAIDHLERPDAVMQNRQRVQKGSKYNEGAQEEDWHDEMRP
jgi:hypothetical protein